MSEDTKCHYDDPEEMHQVIAQRLKETRQYTGEFVELFRYDKDGKIKMRDGILTLRFRYIVLIEDKTLVSMSDLFGVVGFTCNFEGLRHGCYSSSHEW